MRSKRIDRKQADEAERKLRKQTAGQDSNQIEETGEASLDTAASLAAGSHTAMLAGAQTDGERQSLTAQLQQTHGNAYVQRLVDALPIQAKLTVNPPGDKYEQEADRVANIVTSAPVTQRQEAPEEEELIQGKLQRQEIPEEEEIQAKLQRQGTPDEEEELIQGKLQRQEIPEEEEIQAKLQRQAAAEVPEVTGDIEQEITRRKGNGQPLSEDTRTTLEPQLGYNLSGVRVHNDTGANRLSRQLEAEAFTTGNDIFFRDGAYEPNTSEGKKLIAHELTHVIQQSGLNPAVQRDVPSAIEVEGSLSRAGVRPDFPPIWAQLREQADAASYMSFERWQRVTQDESQAEALFGQGLNLAWGQVRNQFLTYLIGSAATGVAGNLLRIIPQIDEALDEASWERDMDYRRMRIYGWLLKQLAMACASAERGYQIEGWDSGVQQIFTMLVTQTVNYQTWMESDDALEFRRRAAAAQGPAGEYGGYYSR